MIIHLTGSSKTVEKDYPFYKAIMQIITENDGILAQDWIEAAYHSGKSKKSEEVDWKKAVDDDFDAISRSDVVIIEISDYSYTQGFQTAIALQLKKPTLLVYRGKLERHAASGLRNRLLTKADYRTEDDLKKTVKKFIRANTIATKDLRFNMFIDRPIYNFLRNVSFETGKNKSEIIRELINREIGKQKD